MKGKIITIMVMTLVIASTVLQASKINNNQFDGNNTFNNALPPIILDQSQDEQTNSRFIPWLSDRVESQTFKPSMSNIVKIELWIVCTKAYHFGWLKMELKQGSTVLFDSHIDVNNLPSSNQQWIEFWTPNQDPVLITPGNIYEIEVTVPVHSEILWGFSMNNPYSDGESSIGITDDFCFRTYAEQNVAPDKPDTPTGNISGKTGTYYQYSSRTIDQNGDQVYYKWHWGNVESNWDGPYNSGDIVTASHSWSTDGTYPVKVKSKDIHDEESPWSDPLSVTVPKNKNRQFKNLWINEFLENHPCIFPILRQLFNI
jgi:hypothetical protein